MSALEKLIEKDWDEMTALEKTIAWVWSEGVKSLATEAATELAELKGIDNDTKRVD